MICASLSIVFRAKRIHPVGTSYHLGATEPIGLAFGAAATNRIPIEHSDEVTEMLRLVAIAAQDLLEGAAPPELLQADVDVPLTFGDANNRVFNKSASNK